MADLSQLTQAALGLPLDQRIRLAQELWASLQPEEADGVAGEIRDASEEAERRDAELDSGSVTGISHEEAIETARKSLRCE
jgi:hypothetical protein